MLVEVVAVVLERALATLPRFDPTRIGLRPPARDPSKAKLRNG